MNAEFLGDMQGRKHSLLKQPLKFTEMQDRNPGPRSKWQSRLQPCRSAALSKNCTHQCQLCMSPSAGLLAFTFIRVWTAPKTDSTDRTHCLHCRKHGHRFEAVGPENWLTSIQLSCFQKVSFKAQFVLPEIMVRVFANNFFFRIVLDLPGSWHSSTILLIYHLFPLFLMSNISIE